MTATYLVIDPEEGEQILKEFKKEEDLIEWLADCYEDETCGHLPQYALIIYGEVKTFVPPSSKGTLK